MNWDSVRPGECACARSRVCVMCVCCMYVYVRKLVVCW